MYIALLIGLILVGAWFLARGIDRHRRGWIVLGASLLGFDLLLFGSLDFWGDMLWYESLGFSERFWTVIAAKLLTALLGGLLAGGVTFGLTWSMRRSERLTRHLAWVVALVGGLVAGTFAWDEALLFLNRVPGGTTDPVLGRDVGLYLFTVPFLRQLHGIATWAVVVTLMAVAAASVRQTDGGTRLRPAAQRPVRTLLVGTAALAVVLAADRGLTVFGLLTSEWGVVSGPGWTDVHVRLPAQIVVAVLTLLLGSLPLWGGARRRIASLFTGSEDGGTALRRVWGTIVVVWVVALVVAPRLVQWLVVEPNEITFERPYIANNIEFTRKGFALDRTEPRRFPASERLTLASVEDDRDVLDEVRLWDPRALDAVYEQFQEIRLYYEFEAIDIDRYEIDGRTRQVMVSAREMEVDNLPPQSQTFVNRRFKYTHGYGLTLATVSEFTPQGLPELLVRDIPPRSESEELAVEVPQIYYGELTDTPAVVNTSEPEFDHPSGDRNVTNHYQGTGGVQLSNLWRKFVIGWMFDGTRLLVSSYPHGESRALFHRQVRERVQRVAPFLEIDEDPYVVLVDGRLIWIVDAYTHSSRYPYSEPYSSYETIEYRDGSRTRTIERRTVPTLHGANYVRNAVKAVVDAYEGSVDLYVFEPDDPLIRAWDRALPGLLQPREAMPEAIEAHVRYPVDLLLVQGLVHAKYHMLEPDVFYNQEDLWVRATEKYYAQVQPVEPYYVMWEPAGTDETEFVLILPFTPKNRQVLIGWIAGMSDPPDYGRFLAYEFPKDRRVLGPQQVETKIDQDRFLSGQLTLWDQRGSNVIRGNVLAIPLDESLLYVEPIYLQADTAAYPELRLVAVMHGDDLSYAETFDEALAGLFAEREEPPDVVSDVTRDELVQRAADLLEDYARLQGESEFGSAGARLDELQSVLQQLLDGTVRAEVEESSR